MAAKHFLAKLLLGRDINEDLAMAEKGNREVHGKYNNACQTISVLEEKNRLLSDSLDTSKHELSFLKIEKISIDALLSQLLNDEVLCDAKEILESKYDDKKALLGNLIEKLRAFQKEHDLILDQFGKLKEEKTSSENDVDKLNHEIESLKEKSKQREEQKTKISQRKEVRDNLSTLKDKWQGTLDEFKARIDDADNLKSQEGFKLELVDYERLVNNAIEISVK